jgi:hypothetical protein
MALMSNLMVKEFLGFYTMKEDKTSNFVNQSILPKKLLQLTDKDEKHRYILGYITNWLICICIIVITLVYLKAHQKKNYHLNDSNNQVITDNGNIIVRNSTDLCDTLYRDLITKSVLSNRCLNTAHFKKAYDMLTLYTYDDLQSYMLPSEKSNINAQGVDLDLMHKRMTTMLESCDRCNALLANFSTQVPFPVSEFTTWIIILIVSMMLLAILFTSFNPKILMEKIRYLKKAKGDISSFPHGKQQKTDFGNVIEFVRRYGVILLVPILTVLLAVGITSESNKWTQQLHLSLDCHKL